MFGSVEAEAIVSRPSSRAVTEAPKPTKPTKTIKTHLAEIEAANEEARFPQAKDFLQKFSKAKTFPFISVVDFAKNQPLKGEKLWNIALFGYTASGRILPAIPGIGPVPLSPGP